MEVTLVSSTHYILLDRKHMYNFTAGETQHKDDDIIPRADYWLLYLLFLFQKTMLNVVLLFQILILYF